MEIDNRTLFLKRVPDSRAVNLINFIDASPTPHHAVQHMRSILIREGFYELEQGVEWYLNMGSGYFVLNNGSIIAFRVGQDGLVTDGCRIIAAHTDSPNLRLKPKPVVDRSGYAGLLVEPYGGVLLSSWLDRDLSLAGVIYTREKTGVILERLIKVSRPVARISQLAIHLNREVNEKGLVVNPQTQMLPVIGLTDSGVLPAKRFEEFIREYGGISDESIILSSDLSLYDTQASAFGGLDGEFIYAPRLDNLASCYSAIEALINVSDNPKNTAVVACFNHEEVGSASAEGADSPFLQNTLERISLGRSFGPPRRDEIYRMMANSFCISSDMAHALNPNYPEKHESAHAPVLNGGMVIKTNVNQRYATDARTTLCFMELCAEAGVPYQHFVNRADLACGSTIGPITSSRLGIPTVDVGAPMFSMHSIRECVGTSDIIDMVKVYTSFFAQ